MISVKGNTNGELMLTSATKRLKKTLVLGIGNTLLSDEGVGVHVLHELQQNHHIEGDIEYLDGGTLSFTLAGPIESCDQFIVVDAAELKSAPGTVQVFEAEAMDNYITNGNKRSVHEVGLADLLSIALLSGHLPEKRALVGIQPQKLDWGEQPTPRVADAIPLAASEVSNLVNRWQQ